MKLVNLRVANLVRPLGLDLACPRFSWNVETDVPSWKQAACRVEIAASKADAARGEALLWDSGKVETPLLFLSYENGSAFASDTRLYWCVTVWPQGGGAPVRSAPEWFHTGLLRAEDWKGRWIGETQDNVSHLWRGAFTVPGEIAFARLYVCGLGHYEACLNGIRIGDRVLEPGWTAYDKTVLYSAYDVTDLLCVGNNALGVTLADGMFNVVGNDGGRHVYYERSYGKMKLLAQLNLTLADGTEQQFYTDERWKMAQSEFTFCSVYGGEDVDLRLEQPSFSAPNAQIDAAHGWMQAVCVDPPQGKLQAQLIAPCKVMEIYRPQIIGTPRADAVVYDFGKNFSGWPKLTLQGGVSGTKIRLFPAELLGADGLPNQFLTRDGFCWTLTLDGRAQTVWAPRFSYYGFRYLLVEGVSQNGAGALPQITGLEGQFVYPDAEAAGEFTCSNVLFNQIHAIVRQAMYSNMKSYLTDCPHREKLPWMEQTHLIGPGLLYNFDLLRLYDKIEQDMADTQYDDGLVPDICPQYVKFGYHRGFNDSPEWGSASVMNPWYIYRRYGDASLLHRYYHTMRRYTDYLTTQTHHHVLHHGLGDWLDIGPCPPHSQNTPVPVIATCMYHLDIMVMIEAARIVGNTEDVARYTALSAAVRSEFRAQFLDVQNTREIWVANGSQAAQAMALLCGMIDPQEETQVLQCLVKDIEKRGWATTAGDVGHPFVLAALTQYGRGDVVAKMAEDTEKPGYGYQVKHGATTLTEDWDGPDPARPHGSQNHFMLGAIEEWFASGLAGFGGMRDDRPFGTLRIAPAFVTQCDSVSAWTLHPYGCVSLTWTRGADGITVQLTIPAGLEVLFSANQTETVLGSGAHCFTVADPTRSA